MFYHFSSIYFSIYWPKHNVEIPNQQFKGGKKNDQTLLKLSIHSGYSKSPQIVVYIIPFYGSTNSFFRVYKEYMKSQQEILRLWEESVNLQKGKVKVGKKNHWIFKVKIFPKDILHIHTSKKRSKLFVT